MVYIINDMPPNGPSKSTKLRLFVGDSLLYIKIKSLVDIQKSPRGSKQAPGLGKAMEVGILSQKMSSDMHNPKEN